MNNRATDLNIMHSVKQLHSFQLPSYAQSIQYINTVEKLRNLQWSSDLLFLGEGTNTLFIDNFSGTVLVNQLKGVSIQNGDHEWDVWASAGENWHEFVMNLLKEGVFGLENLVLIPGSVGAAPVQNIGAYGVEVSHYIHAVEVWDFNQKKRIEIPAAQCEFGYRDSVFKRSFPKTQLITRVHFKIPKAWAPVLHYGPLAKLSSCVTAHEVAEKVIEIRQSKLPDPALLANAGSFFKNPIVSQLEADALLSEYSNAPHFPSPNNTSVKFAAGWLIEQCGLKGFCVGDACVHDKQALVLVNRNAATKEDIVELAKTIQSKVLDKFRVQLEPEVRLIGLEGERTLNE